MPSLPPNYVMMTKMGHGTFGDVYECRDTNSGRTVAVKAFKEKYDVEAGWDFSIIRETVHLRMAKDYCKHIVQMYDACIVGRCFFVSMEVMECSLYKYRQQNSTDDSTLVSYARGIVAGVEWLHSHSIMHRDLKLQNILIDANGVCKVADLGSARHYRSGRRYTLEVCTPQFRALEVLYGDDHYGLSIDIWSLGCLLYELVAKKMLFPGDGTAVGQLQVIAETLGTPTNASWANVEALPYYNQEFPSPQWMASGDCTAANCYGLFRQKKQQLPPRRPKKQV